MKTDDDSSQPNTEEENTEIPNKDNQSCQLNDDCLLHIVKYLKFSDLVNFARSCDQFQNVFVLHFRSNFKEFSPQDEEFDNFSTSEQRELLKLVGCHIQTLKTYVEFDHSTIFELFGKSCPNLRTLDVMYRYKALDVNQLVNNMQMITELHLCALPNTMSDNDILILTRLAQLKKFTLWGNCNFTGKHLNQMKALQYLSLNNCNKLEPKHLIEMVNALNDLITLKFFSCKIITLEVCHAMIQHSRKLEYLAIDLLEDFEIIASLPSLKSLEITFDRYEYVTRMLHQLVDTPNQLEVLTVRTRMNYMHPPTGVVLAGLKNIKVLDKWFYFLSKMENLRRIDLFCICITINDGILKMVASCKRLSYVKIVSLVPTIIDETFFPEMIALLRSNQQQSRVLPVLFDFEGFGNITTDPEFSKAVREGIIRIHCHNDAYFKC